jgi:hypothetical protein
LRLRASGVRGTGIRLEKTTQLRELRNEEDSLRGTPCRFAGRANSSHRGLSLLTPSLPLPILAELSFADSASAKRQTAVQMQMQMRMQMQMQMLAQNEVRPRPHGRASPQVRESGRRVDRLPGGSRERRMMGRAAFPADPSVHAPHSRPVGSSTHSSPRIPCSSSPSLTHHPSPLTHHASLHSAPSPPLFRLSSHHSSLPDPLPDFPLIPPPAAGRGPRAAGRVSGVRYRSPSGERPSGALQCGRRERRTACGIARSRVRWRPGRRRAGRASDGHLPTESAAGAT